MDIITKPEMTLVCGPNGSGKSTLTYGLIQNKDGIPFIDPDRIVKEDKCSPIEAGKKVSRLAKQYISDRQSFLKESTLTSQFDFTLIESAKNNGFSVHLIYICTRSADISVKRVAIRHAMGGHTVPEEDIRRRYERSINNLSKAIKLVDTATIIDNGDRSGYQYVAHFAEGILMKCYYSTPWFDKAFSDLVIKDEDLPLRPER
jgi:predicted ABC-type ATPase